MRASVPALNAIIYPLLASVVAASTLAPPVLPLIVRNPYLSTWLPSARETPWQRWPMFWFGQDIGFSVLASISDTTTVYPLLGRPHDSLNSSDEWVQAEYTVNYPVYLGANYDASTTNLTYEILSPDAAEPPLEIILSFLSPITPTSTLRQSIPASYLTVYVKGSFNVDIYVDINGQWVSGIEKSKLEWEFAQDTSLVPLKRWSVRRQEEKLFEETEDRAEWGTLYFTAPSNVRHESGSAARVRGRFSRTGTLQNEIDNGFRSIMDEEPVFAFSKSFKLASKKGLQKSVEDSVTFTIAHIQDPVVQYASARGLTHMRPLWKSWFSTESEMLSYHYLDFYNAVYLARNYSEQLSVDAEAYGGTDYADVLALSARQVMGATSFSGTPEDPILFLKEISSNGNCQTVDVIFPSIPFFLYTSPRWLAYLLEPLLEHQLSGQYPNKYSMHDLGSHFPNMTGHADGQDEYMPVEECGDMLIMSLALVQSLEYEEESAASSHWSSQGSRNSQSNEPTSIFPLKRAENGNEVPDVDDRWGGGKRGEKLADKWLSRTYSLLKQWTAYLVEFSLEPHNQLSTDDFAGWLALHSNLALKGIIGINAMSELAAKGGYDGDAKYYKNISTTYVAKWQDFATSRDGTHIKLAYNWYGSWTTLYSLYADTLLCFHPTITAPSQDTHGPSAPLQDPSAQQPLSVPKSSNNRTSDFIPHPIYTAQSKFYGLTLQRYGLPLDSRHLYAKSDWLFNAAAIVHPSLRREILDRYAHWVNSTATDLPLTDLFETEDEDGGWGGGVRFFARPVVGAHWAGLALRGACGRGMKDDI
ncbi:DUF1793-domain-containing protein [Rhizodiscina lignyota]|uniref:DUF1793-domain-containing protein n=1 Tax=Rhizodiscina lignyota TaxID=1504668 RepID=A0A9P4IL48_9PEZI|nr:DUF1793-domain-containing protein [Rhizodiscina lignyota]